MSGFKILTFFCLMAAMYANAQTTVVTMTTTNDSVRILVKWTGDGDIISNSVVLKNNAFNIIAATADGLVLLTATGDVQVDNLFCHENSLTALDVTNCPKLKWLGCDLNSLTTLDVTNCSMLIELYCDYNSLTALDVSNCPELTGLNCARNSLTSLDVTHCPKLTRLACSSNLLTTLDVTNSLELLNLSCGSNLLTTLDVTNCTKLRDLGCSDNSLSTLDVANCKELEGLYCSNNFFTTLDVTNCPKLRYMSACFQSPVLPVAVPKHTELSVKSPITFIGGEVSINRISHGGKYNAGDIIWSVSGESGEVKFEFSTKLPEGVSGIPFKGTVKQPWTKIIY